jgi:hypothetical protein
VLIGNRGLEPIGNALWTFYGSASGLTHDALDPSAEAGYAAFYASLETLYDRGFARYCDDCQGHSDRGGKFATACYMLWDMDSGLEHLSFHGSAQRLAMME